MQLDKTQIEKILNLRIYHDTDAILLNTLYRISANEVVNVVLNSGLGDMIQDAISKTVDIAALDEKQKRIIVRDIMAYIFYKQRI